MAIPAFEETDGPNHSPGRLRTSMHRFGDFLTAGVGRGYRLMLRLPYE